MLSDLISSGGFSVLMQLLLSPFLILLGVLITGRAAKMGRPIALAILVALALVPWAFGAFGVTVGYLTAKSAVADAEPTMAAEFWKRVWTDLNKLWVIPGCLMPFFATFLVVAWRKGKPAPETNDFR